MDVPRERAGEVSPLKAPRRAGTFLRLLGFLRPYSWRVALAVGLGLWTVASNLGLLAVSGYLIAAASLKPLLGTLVLVMGLVEVFGGSRAFARYAERLVSHDVTFKLLADLSTWLYGRHRTSLSRPPGQPPQRRFALQDGQGRGGA